MCVLLDRLALIPSWQVNTASASGITCRCGTSPKHTAAAATATATMLVLVSLSLSACTLQASWSSGSASHICRLSSWVKSRAFAHRAYRAYRDAQDRLLWRGKTCPAHTQLIMSVKALILLLPLLVKCAHLHKGIDVAVGHAILQPSKTCAVVEGEVKLVSPSEASLALHIHPLQTVPAG